LSGVVGSVIADLGLLAGSAVDRHVPGFSPAAP